jgi:hypothetical protein
MRQRQLITFGLESKLAQRLHEPLAEHGIGLREVRHAGACVNLLRQGAVGVLLVRVGRDLEQELTLAAQAAQWFPRVAVVVWCDADHPHVPGLAWDLGAGAVLAGGLDLERLRDLVSHFLREG